MANVNVNRVSRVSSVPIPVGKEPTDADVWESATVQTMLSVIMSMENVDVPGVGMGPNVTCPARWAPSGPVARTSATATTTPPATPWTGGASASPVSLEPDAKSFALKAIGEKIAIEPANAKMLTLSAIQFTDAFADRDSQVKNAMSPLQLLSSL